jgi:hypothetical protein
LPSPKVKTHFPAFGAGAAFAATLAGALALAGALEAGALEGEALEGEALEGEDLASGALEGRFAAAFAGALRAAEADFFAEGFDEGFNEVLDEDLDFAGDFRDFDAALAMASSRGREENGSRVTPRMTAPAQAAREPFSTTKGGVFEAIYLMIPSPTMPMKIR